MRLRLVPPTLLLALLAGCSGDTVRRGDADLQLRVTVDPEPATLGGTDVEVAVSDVDWRPRNGARVYLTGSREGVVLVRDTAVGQGAGLYLAESVPFPVAGAWLLTVRVETPGGRWTELERTLAVEPPDGG